MSYSPFSLLKLLFNPIKLIENFFILKIDFGDDGGAPQPIQSTTVTTNIPDYAQPYVENMLGATQNALFNVDQSGQISGFKPYTPYSQNMSDYVAGFSPLQQQAQQGATSLTMPGQFGTGSALTTAGGLGSIGTAGTAANAGSDYYRMATDPMMTKAFMNPYLQQALDPALAEARRQYDITGAQQMGAATRQGAFGGTREALMAAENERNKNLAMNQIIGQGYNTAYQQAQQAQQYGAGLGLQGLQAALQGYGQAGQAGATLGQLGQEQLGAQQGIIGTQAQQGALEQQNQQQMINQAIQNYATQQQYPYMQLGMMSNMLRGLPLSAPTTSMYQAQPSTATQLIGAAGALGSLGQSGVLNTTTKASGGIVGYDVGGSVRAKLEDMTPEQLDQENEITQSPMIKKLIAELKAEKNIDTRKAASGGILAFTEGGDAWDKFKRGVSELAGTKEAREADAEAAAEKDSLGSKLMSAAKYLSGADETAPAKPNATYAAPGITSINPTDVANYNKPVISEGGMQVPGPEIPEVPPAPPVATPEQQKSSRLDQILNQYLDKNVAPPAPRPDANKVETLAGINPEDVVKNLDKNANVLANKLEEIYKDPIQAPYAKKQWDYFQNKIDDAPNKERQMFWLHSATMFATMAATPGGVTKAFMSSLAQQIPLYAKDKEEADKLLDSYNKAQYDLANSEAARRVGDTKSVLELKNAAITKSADIYKTLADNKINKERNEIEKYKAVEDSQYHKGMVAAQMLKSEEKSTDYQFFINQLRNQPEYYKTIDGKKIFDIEKANKAYQAQKPSAAGLDEDTILKGYTASGGKLGTGMDYPTYKASIVNPSSIPGISSERATQFKVIP